jgi:hypothetical protein
MSKEMRKYIDSYKEFLENKKMMEVIVSYDCSEMHKPFGDEILKLLRNEKYHCDVITLSNYKISRLLTIPEIELLKKEIIDLFNECAILQEVKRSKRTVVKIIIPYENQFIIDELLNETE